MKSKHRIEYKPDGRVCARMFTIEIGDGKVSRLTVDGGCRGNSQGVAALIEGMDIAEAVRRLKGIECGGKGTSCPDQLACALEEYTAAENR